MARPLTKAERAALKKRLLEELPKHYGFVLQSAEACGVASSTARRLIDADEELQEAVARCRQDVQDQFGHLVAAVGLGVQTIPATQVTPMIFASKVLGGLSEQQRVEHSGKVDWAPPPKADDQDGDGGAGDGPVILSVVRPAAGEGEGGA